MMKETWQLGGLSREVSVPSCTPLHGTIIHTCLISQSIKTGESWDSIKMWYRMILQMCQKKNKTNTCVFFFKCLQLDVQKIQFQT